MTAISLLVDLLNRFSRNLEMVVNPPFRKVGSRTVQKYMRGGTMVTVQAMGERLLP